MTLFIFILVISLPIFHIFLGKRLVEARKTLDEIKSRRHYPLLAHFYTSRKGFGTRTSLDTDPSPAFHGDAVIRSVSRID